MTRDSGLHFAGCPKRHGDGASVGKGKNHTTDLSGPHDGAHVVLGKDPLQSDNIRLIAIKNSFQLKGQGPDTSRRIIPRGSCVDIHMQQ
jgi:hypothetical protein